ncbi:phosphatase PAP2 family protein [uncultured Hymenobacter sp.]|uniref:phosphatase PAP2 family protein n=1 Tax=uncultured Hymenobacter sp. TaxID=170016 RepID=UPI0035CB8D14
MLDFLRFLDQQLVLALNQEHTPLLDALLLAASSRLAWGPVLLLALPGLWRHYGASCWRLLLPLALSVATTNWLASDLIKPWVNRPRPCQAPDLLPLLHLPVGCSASASFLSTHTADLVTLVGVLSWVLPRASWRLHLVWWSWALVLATSRVYLGQHYPSDVLAGAALGLLVALGGRGLRRPLLARLLPATRVKQQEPAGARSS